MCLCVWVPSYLVSCRAANYQGRVWEDACTTHATAPTENERTYVVFGDCVAASYLVMHLFSQERLKSRGITAAVYGNFFAPCEQQELVLGGPRAAAKCSRAHKAR